MADPDAYNGVGIQPSDYPCGSNGQLDCLPVLRWDGVTGALTSRIDGTLTEWTHWLEQIPQSLSGLYISLGNSLYALAARMGRGVDGDSLLSGDQWSLGKTANRTVGALYTVVVSNPLLIAMPIVATLLIGLFAAWRGQGMRVLMRRLGALSVGLALSISMGATAAAAPDQANTGSPWWVMRTVNQIVSDAGSGLNTALIDSMSASGTFVSDPNGGNDNLTSCQRYIATLDKAAEAQGTDDAITISTNRMWEETGLRVWMRGVYGGGQNSLDVFCRVLDHRAGADAKTMSDLTNLAAGTDIGASEFGVAFWPTMMADTDDLTEEVGKKEQSADSQMLDRYVMTWNVCKYSKKDNAWRGRAGFKFVNALTGKDRRKYGTKDSVDKEDRIALACQAAVTGHADGDDESYLVYDASRADVEYEESETASPGTSFIPGSVTPNVGAQAWQAKRLKGEKLNADGWAISGDARQLVHRLVMLFDAPTDSRTTAAITTNGGGTVAQNSAALTTVRQMRGAYSFSDIIGGFLFLLSGFEALILLGVGVGFMKVVCALSATVSVVVLFVALFAVAYAPDHMLRSIKSILMSLLGAMAGPTVVALAASLGCLFVNLGLLICGLAGAADADASNSSIGMLGLCTLVLPLVYIKGLRWLCVEKLGWGDPFSLPGLKQISGLTGAMGKGMAVAAGAAVAAGVAVATGGAGLPALSAAAKGMGAAMRGGGVVSAAGAGLREGVMNRRFGGFSGSRAPKSGAERAALGGGEAPKTEAAPETAPSGDGFADKAADALVRGSVHSEARHSGHDAAWERAHVEGARASGDVKALAERLDKATPMEAFRMAANGGDWTFRKPALPGAMADAAREVMAENRERLSALSASVRDSRIGQGTAGIAAGIAAKARAFGADAGEKAADLHAAATAKASAASARMDAFIGRHETLTAARDTWRDAADLTRAAGAWTYGHARHAAGVVGSTRAAQTARGLWSDAQAMPGRTADAVRLTAANAVKPAMFAAGRTMGGLATLIGDSSLTRPSDNGANAGRAARALVDAGMDNDKKTVAASRRVMRDAWDHGLAHGDEQVAQAAERAGVAADQYKAVADRFAA